jgi:hypothetical protein
VISDRDGWGFEDSEWGDFDVSHKSKAAAVESKQEIQQKKREERRLKQQEAREKRAAKAGMKPTGLGVVKKD